MTLGLWNAVAGGALTLWLASVVWHAGTSLAALAQPLKRRRVAAPRALPGVTVIVPVSGDAPALGASAAALAGLDYPEFDVMLCASEGDEEAVLAIRMAVKQRPQFQGHVLRPEPLDNPKSALLAAALPLARHALILFSDDNVVSTPGRIHSHLAYREAGFGLVSACVVGCRPLTFWGAVDGAFMNGHFARLQRAGDAVGLSFSTGKSILVSKDALARSGGYAAAGKTVCEDAIVQRDLCAIGEKVTLSHEVQVQPIGRRRLADVWHRHLRWTRCRRRHAPLLYFVEAATSAPVAALGACVAFSPLGIPALYSAGGTLILLLGLEWGFLALARWPSSRWFPAAWLAREVIAQGLWVAALWPGQRTIWRGRPLDLRA